MASQNINPTATYIKPDKKSVNVLVYAAAYVSVIIIFHRLYRFSSGYNERISAWIQLFSYCVFGVTGIILFKDLLKRGIREWKEHPMKNVLWIAGGYIAGKLLDIILYIPGMILFPDHYSINQNNVEILLQYMPAAFALIVIGVFGPCTEETIFRWILVEKGREKLPVVLCVIVSSLLFMFLHVHEASLPEIVSCLPIFGSALVYSISMLKTKNPTIPVILHMLNNSIGVIMILQQS